MKSLETLAGETWHVASKHARQNKDSIVKIGKSVKETFTPEYARNFFRENKKHLIFLGVAALADIVTTALVVNDPSGYGEELMGTPRQFMENYGAVKGQLLLKLQYVAAAAMPATYVVSNVLNKIFKTKESAKLALFIEGMIFSTLAGSNLASYFGVNI